MGPKDLAQVLRHLASSTDPNVLVGINPTDDAGVYRIRDDLAMIQTVDFFTPIVDDPYTFGAIAAANALSDVYAMGGRPVIALNIVCFPSGPDALPLKTLEEILKGGSDKAWEAKVSIIGGHTVDDPEPKYGMAVTGLVHPDRMVANAGARPGDLLVLTKPIGTGIVATAIKGNLASARAIARAEEVMSTLNRSAAEAMTEVGVHACTDVTGFGLLGHLEEMLRASGVGAKIHAAEIPVLPEVRELMEEGMIPAGTYANREFLADRVVWEGEISTDQELLLCDPQTSGGLLIAVPRNRSERLLARLVERRTPVVRIVGEIVEDEESKIHILP